MVDTVSLSDLLDEMMASLRISEAELAQAVNATPRTVQRWRSRETYPQHESRRQLDRLNALVRRLHASFKTPAGAALWLHSESGYFGGLEPIDALLRGRVDAVEAALEALDSGVFV